MHENSSPSLPLSNTVRFEFRDGIPTSAIAVALKFGLEAIAGVESMHFIGEHGIEVRIDTETARLERLWEAITAAGFSVDMVSARGAVLLPIDGALVENTGESPVGESAAA